MTITRKFELSALHWRPNGMRLLCLVLAWHSISAAGGLWILLRLHPPGLPAWILPVIGASALTAAAACIGLWSMRWWGLLSLRCCIAVWFLILIGMVLSFPQRLFLGGYWGLAAVGFVLSWGSGSLNRWVSRELVSRSA